MDISQSQIVSFIWSIADDCLRDVFLRGQYRDVILPMVVLRRFDALLEPTKDEVIDEMIEEIKIGLTEPDAGALCDITGVNFYNTSKWTLNRIKSQATDNNKLLLDNFVEYLNGYSENVKDVLRNFDFYNKAKKMADNDRLLAVIEKITDRQINLTDRESDAPDGTKLPPVSNIAMGTIFEELLRKFNEENNEEAGQHFTPRDVIQLLARLVFEPVKDNLPKIISMYDPACGSGGMLTEGREYLHSIGVADAAIQLNGTESAPEIYAICKSDLIIKGVDPGGMHQGNTITENHFYDHAFGYMLANPPYGKSWKVDQPKIYHDGNLLDHRFELPLADFAGNSEVLDCTPRTSDGQLLFLLEEVDKMKPLEYQPQGSRIASIHNGSSLFTGDAGSGESNTRRYLIENDFVEAIIQFPNNIFYNTGIATYAWLLTNKKDQKRAGKVQLIDASQAYEKIRKNQGSRNCTITPFANQIMDTYLQFKECECDDQGKVASKIFDGDDFRYYNVTIERPLRLKSQFNALKIDEMLFDGELSKWLYETYKDRVFSGLDDEIPNIKDYLQENEIKLTDKKLADLISTKKWCERRTLMETAKQLMHGMGTEVFMDFDSFTKTMNAGVKNAKINVKDSVLKAIAKAMSEECPDALAVVKKVHKANSKDIEKLLTVYGIDESRLADYGYHKTDDGTYVEYESDSSLRDSEKIPVKEDIYDYFQREVRPYVDDAWINLPPTKIGCEISFNKYFYKPAPLRSLEENEADIRALDEQSQGFIKSLFELV